MMINKNGSLVKPEDIRCELARAIKAPYGKQEYHGNGKNAWYGDKYILYFDNGAIVTVERKSRRYSYRWHKTVVTVDGERPTAATYKRLRVLAGLEA